MRKANIIFMTVLLVISVISFCFFSNPVENNNKLVKDNSYQINNFDMEINVNENNSFSVTENITVKFLQSGKHGIFRNLPIINTITKEEDNKIITEKYRLKYSDISATKLVEKYEENGNLILVLGDEYNTFNLGDTYTFKVKYLLTVGDDKNNKYDEFYYNVLGSGWSCDIINFKATIKFFKDISGTKLYKYYNNYEQEFTVSGNSILVTENNISYGTPITLRAKFDNGFFSTKKDNLIYYILTASIFIIGLISYLIYLKGSNKNAIISVVEFNAPEGVSPCVCGYIIDRYVDDKDLASLIVYFANKNFLKIISDDNKNIKLEKLKDIENVTSYEKDIFNNIFKDDNVIALKDVGNKIYKQVEKAKLKIQKDNEAKYFKDDSISYYLISFLPILILVIMGLYIGQKAIISFIPFTLVRISMLLLIVFTYLLIGLYQKRFSIKQNKFNILKIVYFTIISISLAVYLIFANDFYYDIIFAKLFAVISYLLSLYLSLRYNERTNEGNKLAGKLLGLKQFILSTEKDRLELLCKENPYMFFDILPYAYVFGISDVWIKKFESIIIKMPPTYSFNCDIVDLIILNNICRSLNFVNDSIRECRAQAIANKVGKGVSNSGFGGGNGGGFSGGGFGGGGGGSW